MERFILNKSVSSSNDADKSTSGDEEVKKGKYSKYDDSYLDFGWKTAVCALFQNIIIRKYAPK